MLFPRTGESYLDADQFRPIFEAAAELDVPLYLHPEISPRYTCDLLRRILDRHQLASRHRRLGLARRRLV